jgi:N-acetylglucosaminyl-diphospho-decaprenol L-rhamnosyltransferase
MIDVSIVIVSWNVAELLAKCLDSILASPFDRKKLEIIVVDSASSDNTVAMLREEYPQITLLAQSANIGFTRGNNIGFKAAKGRYLFMLNPDTEIIGDAISQMLNYLDTHTDVGIVGPHTLNPDRTTQSSRRSFPSKSLAFFESTFLQEHAPKAMLENYYLSNYPDDAVLDVGWMQGSALLIRREIFETLSGLDENFVMFFEELDWCKRAADAGWRLVYFGTAQIIHHGGKSTEQSGAKKHIWFQESKIRYYRKHHGVVFATILWLFLLFNYLWQMIIEGLKAVIGHKRSLRKERLSIYWQVLRSGLRG